MVHIVVPAPLVHSLLPARGDNREREKEREEGGVRGAVASNNIFIKHVECGRLNQEPLIVTETRNKNKKRKENSERRERKDEAEET